MKYILNVGATFQVLSIVQQFSGMSILRAYVVKIFNDVFSENGNGGTTIASLTNCTTASGLTSTATSTSSEAYISAIILGLVRFFASLLLSRLLRRFRRRFMYFLSAFMTLISLISFATCNLLIQRRYFTDDVIDLKWASLVTACLLVFSVQLGIREQISRRLINLELFRSFYAVVDLAIVTEVSILSRDPPNLCSGGQIFAHVHQDDRSREGWSVVIDVFDVNGDSDCACQLR